MKDNNGGSLTFGERLYYLRTAKNISQLELSQRIGVTNAHICHLEKGRKKEISARVLLRMAEYFKVSPYWLFFGSPYKRKSD